MIHRPMRSFVAIRLRHVRLFPQFGRVVVFLRLRVLYTRFLKIAIMSSPQLATAYLFQFPRRATLRAGRHRLAACKLFPIRY